MLRTNRRRLLDLSATLTGLALLGAIFVTSNSPVYSQEITDLTTQEDQIRKRDRLQREENIRYLHTQQKYAEVIREADALLAIEATNKTAITFKNMAEKSLSLVGLPEETPSAPGLGSARPVPEIVMPEKPQDTVTYEPEPLQPRTRSLSSFSKPEIIRWVLIGVGILVGIGLLVLLIFWLKNRNQKPVGRSAAAGMGGLGGLGGGIYGDQPTVKDGTRAFDPMSGRAYDLPTQQNVFDQQTGEVQPDGGTGLMNDPRTARDPKTSMSDPRTAMGDPNTAMGDPNTAMGDPSTSYSAAPEQSALFMDGIHFDEPPPAPAQSSIGIDYNDTDSPFTRSQENDVYQTAGTAFASQPPELVGAPSQQPRKPTADVDIVPPEQAPPVLGSLDDAFSFSIEGDEPPAPKAAPAPPAKTPAPTPKAAPPPAAADPKTSIDLGDLGFDLTLPSPAVPASAASSTGSQSATNDPTAETFNSMMFGADATAPIPPSAPAAPAKAATPEAEDLTFNSLMFGGTQTQNIAPAASEAPKTSEAKGPEADAEDLTLNSFNQQFSNVMFGSGADETAMGGLTPPAKAPEKVAPPAPAPAAAPKPAPAAAPAMSDDPDVTNVIPSLQRPAPVAAPAAAEDDPDKTVSIPASGAKGAPAAGAATGKTSMFDRQRDAGIRAMEQEDFARAVQCFSVAASLKPADKEIRDLLEEARKKRRT